MAGAFGVLTAGGFNLFPCPPRPPDATPCVEGLPTKAGAAAAPVAFAAVLEAAAPEALVVARPKTREAARKMAVTMPRLVALGLAAVAGVAAILTTGRCTSSV